MSDNQRVQIYPIRSLDPLPLPPREEIEKKLEQHPQVQKIRAGGHDLERWFSTPLDGEVWSAWGLKAEPDAIGMTYMAINRVSPVADPPEVGAPRTLYTRYIK